VEAKGIRFAYRQFGKQSGVPLVFMQHFRGGLDHWDPVITDGFGRDRPVILFDNAGVAGLTAALLRRRRNVLLRTKSHAY
jgi:pimeloyl-ACP methyl ester carboxylesterase